MRKRYTGSVLPRRPLAATVPTGAFESACSIHTHTLTPSNPGANKTMVDKRTAAGVIAWIGLMACCSQSFIIPPTQPETARRAAVVMMEAQEACLPRRDVLLQTTGAGLLVSAMLLGSLPRPAIAAESSSAVGYYSQVCL